MVPMVWKGVWMVEEAQTCSCSRYVVVGRYVIDGSQSKLTCFDHIVTVDVPNVSDGM